MRFEFQEGIGMAIRKEVLRRRGALAHAGIRPPGGVLDQTTQDALDRVMEWVEAGEGMDRQDTTDVQEPCPPCHLC